MHVTGEIQLDLLGNDGFYCLLPRSQYWCARGWVGVKRSHPNIDSGGIGTETKGGPMRTPCSFPFGIKHFKYYDWECGIISFHSASGWFSEITIPLILVVGGQVSYFSFQTLPFWTPIIMKGSPYYSNKGWNWNIHRIWITICIN